MLRLNKSAVEVMARALMETNGKTTTLEVKNTLRGAGFMADQTEVGRFMDEIGVENSDVSYTVNWAGYREYTITKPVPTPVIVATPSIRASGTHTLNARDICVTCGCSKGYIDFFKISCKKAPNACVVSVTPPMPVAIIGTDYTVSDSHGRFARTYRGVSRGTAKNKWAKDTGNNFFDARATRLNK